jgi:hypothetical protein
MVYYQPRTLIGKYLLLEDISDSNGFIGTGFVEHAMSFWHIVQDVHVITRGKDLLPPSPFTESYIRHNPSQHFLIRSGASYATRWEDAPLPSASRPALFIVSRVAILVALFVLFVRRNNPFRLSSTRSYIFIVIDPLICNKRLLPTP